jgi:hypothetical protein
MNAYKWSQARCRAQRHGHRAATAVPWASRAELPSHWFFRPPNPPGTSPRLGRNSLRHSLHWPCHPLAGIAAAAGASPRLRCARPPALRPPQVSTQIGPAPPLAPPQPLAGQARRRGRRNCSWPRHSQAQGPHCKARRLSEEFCANLGHNCEHPNLSRCPGAK